MHQSPQPIFYIPLQVSLNMARVQPFALSHLASKLASIFLGVSWSSLICRWELDPGCSSKGWVKNDGSTSYVCFFQKKKKKKKKGKKGKGKKILYNEYVKRCSKLSAKMGQNE